MSGSFGSQFRITTWGESHGVGVVIDGCPSRILLRQGGRAWLRLCDHLLHRLTEKASL